MLSEMSVQEYNTWMVLEQVEPFGEYGKWLQTGMIISALANIHRDKDQRPFVPTDFMPVTYRPEVKPQTAKTIKQIMLAAMEYQNKLVEQRNGSLKGN